MEKGVSLGNEKRGRAKEREEKLEKGGEGGIVERQEP